MIEYAGHSKALEPSMKSLGKVLDGPELNTGKVVKVSFGRGKYPS